MKHAVFRIIGVTCLVGIAGWLAWRPTAVPKLPATALAVTPAPDSTSLPVALGSTPGRKQALMQTILEAVNHKPIEFYGVCVDQFGKRVPDVQVYAEVIYNTGATGGTIKKQTLTDINGLFSIHGLLGRTLDIDLSKEGYAYGNDVEAFHYTGFVDNARRHHPDKERPVLFPIWKLQGPDPLLKGRKNFDLPHDGSEVRIDLREGKTKGEGGDCVCMLRCESLARSEVRKFSWNLEIRASGSGGVLVTKQRVEAMFAAPEEPYLLLSKSKMRRVRAIGKARLLSASICARRRETLPN